MIEETLFHADCVLIGVNVTSKKQLFQDVATALVKTYNLTENAIAVRDIVSAAVERERLGSTGVGNGVALPHARVKGLEKVLAAFVRLDTPLDFDAIDDRPIDLAVFLLAPEDAGSVHLRTLAHVSRLMRRQDVRTRLRAAPSAEALYTILSEQQEATAA